MTKPLPTARLAAMLIGAALALPCAAESLGSAASSASSAGSASLGSLSDSVRGSSNSSRGDARTAHGDYRVIEVAAVQDAPALMELRLRPADQADGTADLWLRLPRQAVAARTPAVDDVVNVRQRPYGLAFAFADAQREPFYLALHEAWQRDLGSQAL